MMICQNVHPHCQFNVSTQSDSDLHHSLTESLTNVDFNRQMNSSCKALEAHGNLFLHGSYMFDAAI